MGEGDLESFVNARDQDDQTPLMIASFQSHYSLIELLVHTGVDVNMRDKENDTAISLMIKMSKSKSSPIPNIDKSPEIYQVIRLFYLLWFLIYFKIYFINPPLDLQSAVRYVPFYRDDEEVSVFSCRLLLGF